MNSMPMSMVGSRSQGTSRTSRTSKQEESGVMYISENPVRDAEMHEEEMEEAKYLCCAECGEHIYLGEDVYEFNNSYFCSVECLMDSLEVRVRCLEKEDLRICDDVF